jgi:hypothetical protein
MSLLFMHLINQPNPFGVSVEGVTVPPFRGRDQLFIPSSLHIFPIALCISYVDAHIQCKMLSTAGCMHHDHLAPLNSSRFQTKYECADFYL